MRRTVPLGSPCPKCNEVHDRCAGHRKSDGRPCRNHHRPGLEVCGTHGGKSPRAVAVTERFLAEQEAVASLAHVQVVPIADPLTELGEVAAEFRAMQRHMANEVAQLESWTGPNHLGEEVFNVRVTMLRQLMADVSRLLTDWVRLGFDERLVALHERHAALVADVVRATLDDPALGLDETTRAAGRRVAADHLRLVAA